jgi:hypothetical protein
MNYMCEIIEDEKTLVKIDHLHVHLINLRTNAYLFQNPQLTVFSTKQLYDFSQLLAHSCFSTAES